MEEAWAAGFFDGEGCISLMRNRNNGSSALGRKYLRLSVAQKDRRPLERFLLFAGCGGIHRQRWSRDSEGFQWTVAGAQAHNVLAVLMPNLSAPKRTQAETKLAELARWDAGVT